MIQPREDIESFYAQDGDPWAYENNPEDLKRKEILLEEIPHKNFQKVLDIGCGNGFITRDLPGKRITGVDISDNAIRHARANNNDEKIEYKQMNIFDLAHHTKKYDLIIITGVLYGQYIGNSNRLIYKLIDDVLEKSGTLISVHIDEWYSCRFPLDLISHRLYYYQQYIHRLEVYHK